MTEPNTVTNSGPYPPRGLFITGTDTNVGKTYICALIAQELISADQNIGIYKPACSGSVIDSVGQARWEDVETLAAAIGTEISDSLRTQICPQCFHAPFAPPVAAALAHQQVDAKLLRRGLQSWNSHAEFMLVEGVGGLLCPLTEDETIADLAKDFQYPLLVVARAGLGTINQTLLTIEAAQQRELPVAGIILNRIESTTSNEILLSNIEQIAHFSNVPILSVVDVEQSVYLRSCPKEEKIDWLILAEG